MAVLRWLRLARYDKDRTYSCLQCAGLHQLCGCAGVAIAGSSSNPNQHTGSYAFRNGDTNANDNVDSNRRT